MRGHSELYRSMKCREFIEQVRKYKASKKDCVPPCHLASWLVG